MNVARKLQMFAWQHYSSSLEKFQVVFELLQCTLLQDKHFGRVRALISSVHRWLKIKAAQLQLAGWPGFI